MKLLLTLSLLLISSIVFTQEPEHVHDRGYALIENKGQWPEGVFFQSRSQGQNLWVQQHGFLYDLRYHLPHADFSKKIDSTLPSKELVSAYFVGSNNVSTVEKKLPTTHYFNYFLGNDSSKWARDVHGYGEVILKDLYPSVDLHVFDQDRLKYELWCYPGSDPTKVQLAISGAKNIRISEGRLLITCALGVVIEEKPKAFTLSNGVFKPIDCSFELTGNVVSWKLGKYNPNDIVIIDPELIFATYSGSVTDNFGMTATYDYAGHAFSAGTIFGNAYPVPDPAVFSPTSVISVQNGSPTSDVFISKYSPDGTQMLWTNFLGGDETQGGGAETVHSLICDLQNNLYAFGATSSWNFPTVNAYQNSLHGGTTLNVVYNGANFGTAGTDIWISRLSSDGHALLGSTYVGGSGNDGVNTNVYGASHSYNNSIYYDSLTHNYGDQFRGEIMLDPSGNCLIASSTQSNDFPVVNAFQPSNAGMQDGVLFKLSPDLSNMIWSSYYGGSNNDGCYSVKVDSSLNVVFAGGTSSTNLPQTTGAYQAAYNGGKSDGFAGKLSPAGTSLIRSTYIGASAYDQAMFAEINRNDEVFLFGQSDGSQFPMINAQGDPGAGQYIIKLTPDLTGVVNSKTFGWANHNSNVSPAAFLVDICGNMYVTAWGGNVIGSVPSSNLPVSSDALYPTPPNGFDFYLGVFKNDFTDLIYGSWLGGSQAMEHVDGGTSRFDKNGVIYQSVCGGCGGHSDFPTSPGAWSAQNLSTNCNNVVFKYDFELIPEAEFTVSDIAGCAPFTVGFSNTSKPSDSYEWIFGNGQSSTTIFNPVITYTQAGNYEVLLITTDSICLLRDTARILISVGDPFPLVVTNDTVLCGGQELNLWANTNGVADNFIWSSNNQFSDTLNSDVSVPEFDVSTFSDTTFYLSASNFGCRVVDSVHVSFILGAVEITGPENICIGDTASFIGGPVAASEPYTLQWAPSDSLIPGPNQNTVYYADTNDIEIFLTATSSTGCVVSDSINLTIDQIIGLANATANPVFVAEGHQTTLSGNPSGYFYYWFPTEGVEDPTARVTNAVVEETTVYTLTITSGACEKSDTVKVITVATLCDNRYVYVPNAFSPNDDGENDILFVRSAIATEIEFKVFDRWGEKIFDSRSTNDGWDGTFRGRRVDPDVYDYYLRAVCDDGQEHIIKGNITLIR